MKHRQKSLVLTAVFAALVSLGMRVQAQIVQTFTVPTGTSSPFSQGFTFNKFNSAIGGLTSVTLSLNGSLLSNIDIFNANGVNTAYSGVDSGIHEAVTGPGGQSESFALLTTPALSGTAAPGTTVLSNISGSKSGIDTVPFVDFSFYSAIGGGTGTLTAAGNTLSFNGNATPGLTFGGSGTAGEIITLTYNFTPTIPEPGAATFLVAGMFGGICVLARRRRKSSPS